jgi:hypothetical protein
MASKATKKPASVSSSRDKRMFLFSLALFLGTVVVLFLLTNRSALAPSSVPVQPTIQHMTLEPQVVANLTEFPSAPPLTGELADQLGEIQTLLNACPDYRTERRSQMQQHIDWMLTPATIPADVLIALGSNPNERLIFGMATYTQIEWNTRDKPAESCLIPLGKMLNGMLVAQGTPPLPEFE